MPASHEDPDLSEDLEHSLQDALRTSFPEERSLSPQSSPAEQVSPTRAPEALPRRIAGGFDALSADLDRRSRENAIMVRLLDQQRTHLATAEAERDRLYEALARIVPEANESGRSLARMMETAKSGDLSGDLSREFGRNLRALDELESVAKALSANLLWTRSGWEQYARSVIGAHKMRDEPGA